MIFKFIGCSLERSDMNFSQEEGYPFYLKSRSLCDFLERKISLIKYDTEGFNKFSIRGFKNDPPVADYINSCKVLCIYLENFNYEEYVKINKDDIKALNEFYIEMLLEGLERAKKYNLPAKEIIDAIEEFRENNYVNLWVFKRKRIVGKKANCFIECNITTHTFKLDLVIEQFEKEIYRENYIKEVPNDMINHYHFGDLQVSKERIITVTDRRKKILLEFDSNSILS